MSQPDYSVRNRAKWILRLLYAKDVCDRYNTPLFGKTRLQKACFLLDRKLKEKFEVDTGFDFRPDKYGPFDPRIYDAVNYLEEENLLSVDSPNAHDEKYDMIRYRLTGPGISRAEELYRNIPEEQQELVRWVKNKHAMKKLGRLLTYVYNEYPEMTTESELV